MVSLVVIKFVCDKIWEEESELRRKLLNIKELGFIGFENKVVFYFLFFKDGKKWFN